MAEIIAILSALRKSVSDWVLKTFSLVFILTCLVLSIVLSILQYRYLAPLEVSETILLIGFNTAVCLLVGYAIRFVLQRLKKKE